MKGYFHKLRMEYYCFGKVMHLGYEVQNILGIKIHTSYKISKFCWHFRGTKTRKGKKFWNLNFFLFEKIRLYRYYQNKNQLGVTSSSYINLTMKLLIKSKNSPKKQDKNFTLNRKRCINFVSDRLFIFSEFIVTRWMMRIK